MKYTCEVEINRPIHEVAALWENESYFHKWQDEFSYIQLMAGIKNTEGALSKIVFDGDRKIILKETILKYNMPHEKIAEYEHTHMTNTQRTTFKKINENKTLFKSEVEYTKFNGLFIKIIAKLFPGKFRQQSQKWMDQFKAFAENA